MAETKIKFNFFSIADFREEEDWLREQHKNGWKLTGFIPPFIYKFEKCEPEDVIYRLDYRSDREENSYIQMFRDFGWTYLQDVLGWFYFTKPASEATEPNEDKLLSDKESRYKMLQSLVKNRMLPICILFFSSAIPTIVPLILGGDPLFPAAIGFPCGLVFGFDFCILIKSSRKLKRMLAELE